ncbi:MAG: PAS domain S-box protein [Candidatus Eisenbacteria bacterium]|nr:PAS domain S-box protein [Candidatus Eisenbacteria bacterium]
MESGSGSEPAGNRRADIPAPASRSSSAGIAAGYFEAVVRQLAAAVVVTDLDRRIRLWSAGAERLLGYRADEIVGEPYARLVPDDLLESDAKEIRRRVLESDQVLYFPTQHLTKDGRRVRVEVCRSFLRDHDGAPLGYSSVILDQTEKLAMQDRLLQAERLNALGMVVGKVFHELRTPLGVLVLQAEILSEEIDELLERAGDRADAPLASRVRESLAAFAREIQRIEGLAEDYLLMIRPIKAHPSSLRLGDFLDTLESELRGKGERPGCEVRVECRRPDAVVRLDPLQMLRVFHNLAGNSLDAIPDGLSPFLLIHADVEGDLLILSLRDNGPGLPPELCGGGAFEIFATTKRGGSGLGLHLVQEIVLAHGGRISLGNHAEGGAEARIELPMQGADRDG